MTDNLRALTSGTPHNTVSALRSGLLHWRERAPLPEPRAGYMAGVISGRLVIVGGSYWERKRKVWTDRVDVFNPRENRWKASTPMPEPRSDAASVVLANVLYVFGGGSKNEARSDALVLRDGKWRQVADARLPEPRLYSVAIACRDSIYVIGGLRKAGDYSTVSNDLWEWNPKEPRKGWRLLPSLPGPGRISHAATELGGRIYVFAGATGNGANGVRNLNDAYQFNPRNLAWNRLPDLTVARRCWWAVSLRDKVLLLGGYTDTYEKEIFLYDPQSKSLRRAGALPHAICDAKFFRIGSDVIGAGGEAGMGIRGPWTIQARL